MKARRNSHGRSIALRQRLRPQGGVQRGAVVVEMAVITPLLVTLLIGIINFGHMFHVRQVMTSAAREGARVYMQRDDDPMQAKAFSKRFLEQFFTASGSLPEIDDFTVWTTDGSDNVAGGDDPDNSIDDDVRRVGISVDIGQTFLAGNYFPFVDPNSEITVISTMRWEGTTIVTDEDTNSGSGG